MNDRPQLRAFVAELLESKGDTTPFDDAEPLATGGRLDSLEIIQLVAFMEESFGLDFAKVEFNRAHFDSIVSMSEFVSSFRSREASLTG
jgi:acyl carrier protein